MFVIVFINQFVRSSDKVSNFKQNNVCGETARSLLASTTDLISFTKQTISDFNLRFRLLMNDAQIKTGLFKSKQVYNYFISYRG
jgi:hypothetical protein